ncbi:MAG: type II secretion system protein [Rariglobus sp.]
MTTVRTPFFSARRTVRAFTLVELLCVIAIIGVLAAIIIPVTGKVRANARNSQCLSNVRQLAMGNLLYAAENKGQLIVHLGQTLGSNYIMPQAVRNEGNWHKAVARYMSLDKVSTRSRFICPEADLSGVPTSQIENGEISTYTVSMWLHASPAYGRLQAMAKPVVMVADSRISLNDGTYPWNVNDMGNTSYENRVALFRHADSKRRNVALTDGSAHSLSPIQEGVFSDGAGSYLPNYWLPPGATSSRPFSVTSPTDTIPR